MSKSVALKGGGNVIGIIPQDFEETWRIAGAILAGGFAPKSLVDGKSGNDAVSAVCVAVMSGAELGLPPMVSLRSFAIINGKPALYGDGLINVVRGSGKVKRLKTGCEIVGSELVGFCEAERLDTGEAHRVEFTQSQAVQAGLWEENATKRGKIWKDNKHVWVDDAPNNSVWHKYPKRMLAWRATGYCLRELFGDVLGGIRDEFEAKEIEKNSYVEIEQSTPPSPPPAPEEEIEEVDPLDMFLDDLKLALDAVDSEEKIETVFDELDVQSTLTDNEELLKEAFDYKNLRIKEVQVEPSKETQTAADNLEAR